MKVKRKPAPRRIRGEGTGVLLKVDIESKYLLDAVQGPQLVDPQYRKGNKSNEKQGYRYTLFQSAKPPLDCTVDNQGRNDVIGAS